MDHIRKSTNTGNLSSKACNKSNSRSKEHRNRKNKREIINLTAMFEGEKYMAFSGLQKLWSLAKSQLQCYLQLSGLFFFFFFFLFMDLFRNLLQWHFAIICPINKRITLSSTFSCRFVMHSFLPLEHTMTLKHCSAQKVLCKSSQNQTKTLKLILVTTFDVESYFQHIFEKPFTVSKCHV